MQPDKIRLEQMVFYGYHGVNPEERKLGQRFIVDVEVHTNLALPGKSDSLQDTVNYSHVFKIVKEVVEGPSQNLIESVAEIVATRILANFDIESIRVKVAKPEVSVKNSLMNAASVEIFRQGNNHQR